MIIRKHAEAVVADSTVFPVFVDYCKVSSCTYHSVSKPEEKGSLERY